MGFFAEFSAWLNGLLSTYVSEQTTRVAAAIEPACVALASVYVLGWGILQAAGQIEEPWVEGAKRIARVALVIGVGLHLWLYQDLLVDTFFSAPNSLAAAMIGAPDSVTIVDQVIFQGGDAATALRAIEETAKEFAIDAVEMKVTALDVASKAAITPADFCGCSMSWE